jgi:hypothetical protein
MAEPSSWRPDPAGSDGPPRPPTFVQIRPPAAPGSASLRLGMLGAGLALVSALGWAGWRAVGEREAPALTEAAPAMVATAAPRQVVPADLYDELARRVVDTAVAAPAWSRESPIDRLAPFDPSVSHGPPTATPPAATTPAGKADAGPAGSFEVAVQLAKGETIGGALQKQGFATDAIAEIVSVLARHVRLTRLPIGLGMTVQIRPPTDEGGKPILQALTLHPEGRGEIRVGRDDAGNYAMERPAHAPR